MESTPFGERPKGRIQALVYFGLAEEAPTSRYGSGIAGTLDADIDKLNRRIAALEAELRGYQAAERGDVGRGTDPPSASAGNH